MAYLCFQCGATLELSEPTALSRSEVCPSCDADVKCCKNCKFYDQNSYNDCRESQADRITEKERSNFCDYFVLSDGAKGKASQAEEKEDRLKDLDDLFK